MKQIRLLALLLLFLAAGPARADEGMWLPLLLKALNEADMQARGMKMSAEDIYSVNQSSLKDAVVSFGGFCTGEVISANGLLLTNHHCGYGQIQAHSSVENDYLTEGFWAMNRSEEKPCPGLFVRFLVRMEDVTKNVLNGIDENTPEAERTAAIEQRISELTAAAVEGTGYEAEIKPFFYGSEYYMFIAETYRDIRMVGAPPSSVGKFGGDTDNWMWTRHTGDFSMFRIYASPDNKPAAYSPDNVPFKPRFHLPISMKGVKKDDFTLVFGFPGRTSEYLPSYAVETLIGETNPNRIKIRDLKLKLLDGDMQESDEVRIKYASKYASVANYWKKWIGENRGLERLDAVNKKKAGEKEFQAWADADKKLKKRFGNILPEFEKLYAKRQSVNLPEVFINEAVFGVELIDFASRMNRLAGGSDERTLNYVRGRAERFFKDYNEPTDRKLFAALMKMTQENLKPEFLPPAFTEATERHKGDFEAWAKELYEKTILNSPEKVKELTDNPTPENIQKLLEDPAMLLCTGFLEIYSDKIQAVSSETDGPIELLMREYVIGLRMQQKDRNFYPDANSTLRVSFGQVADYEPRDGVQYKHYTTLAGIMEKEVPGAGKNHEFYVPEKLKQLYRDKDYGQYGEEYGLPVCFTAANHTTGGNSGSPVINGEGQLIGINFDRNWEGTMSDIMYDPEMCRNISVDIRYILFIVDKFAGAGHLVEEMTLVKK